jgi:proline racemase
MRIDRYISIVDTHTECDPTRIIIGGIPYLHGKTIVEKRDFFRKHLDPIRQCVIFEPRGHKDAFGAVITDPVQKGSDIGIFFMDAAGYLDLCGHGTMACANVASTLGLVVPKGKEVLQIDTPAGLVTAKINYRDGEVSDVTIRSVPSFLYMKDVEVKTSVGTVNVDISYSGSFFAFLDAKAVGYSVKNEHFPALIKIAMEIKKELNSKVKVAHPEMPHINKVELIEFLDQPGNPEAHYKNLLVYGEGALGRDPCATGACAKIALEVAEGKRKLDEELVYEGILGTIYRARAVEKTKVGNLAAVIPEITGRTFITGFLNIVSDHRDPMENGWLI